MKEFEIGKYQVVKKHDNCKYDGTLMLCSLHKINGKHYPPHQKVVKWYWCNGRQWNSEKRVWESCGYSSQDEI